MKTKSLRVLVVEENKNDYKLVKRALNSNNGAHEIFWAQSGKELDEIYAENKFDILILDMNLPDVSGLEILREFSKKNINIPIIFNTGSSTIQIAVQAMHLGATDFLVKDIEGEYIKILPEVIQKAYASWEDKQARIRAEEALLESEQGYRALFEQSNDPVFIMDLGGVTISVNQKAAKMLGYDQPEMLVGTLNDELITESEIRDADDKFNKLIEGKKIPIYERTFKRKNGSEFPVEVNLSLIADSAGNPSHVQSIVRDISDRRKRELQIQQNSEDLEFLNSLNEAVNLGEDLDQVIGLMCEKITKLVSGFGCIVSLISQDKQYLNIPNYYLPSGIIGKIETLIQMKIPTMKIPINTNSFHSELLNISSPHLINDPAKIKAYIYDFANLESESFPKTSVWPPLEKIMPKIYSLLKIQSVIIMPFIFGQRLIGFLQVSSTDQFTGADQERVAAISERATTLIVHKKLQDARRESEKRYSRLVEEASDSVFEINSSGEFAYVNPAAIRLTGYTFDTSKGITFTDLIVPEWREQVQSFYLNQIENKIQETTFEFPILTKSGQTKWVEQKMTLRIDLEKEYSFHGIIRDITERKQAEEALARQAIELEKRNLEIERHLVNLELKNKQLETLQETGLLLTGGLDLEGVLERIGEQALDSLDANAMLIMVADEEENVLRGRAMSKSKKLRELERIMGNKSRDVVIPLDGSRDDPLVEVAKSRQPSIIPDIRKLKLGKVSQLLMRTLGTLFGIRQLYNVPLQTKDKLSGVLSLGYPKETEFTNEMENLVMTFASQATIAIENARLYEQAQKEIAERKKAEEELAASNRIQETLLEGIPDGVFRIRGDGTLLDFISSDDFETVVPPQEFLGKKILDGLPRDVAEESMRLITQAIKTKKMVIHEYSLLMNEVERYYEARMIPYGDDEVLSIVREVTERVTARKALAASEEKFRDLAELLPQTVWEIDINGIFTYVNKEGFRTYGFTQEDLKEGVQSLYSYVPEDRERAVENARRILSGEDVGMVEYSTLRKDGEIIPIIMAASRILVDGEPHGIRGIIIDITERKQAEEKIAEKERLFRALFEQSNDAVFIMDEHGKTISANQKAAMILGYDSPEDLVGMLSDEVVSEDQIEDGYVKFEELLRGKKLPIYERMFKRKDGSEFPVEVNLSVNNNIEGKPAYFQSIVRDITERKQHEQDLLDLNTSLGERVEERTQELQESLAQVELTLEGAVLSIARIVEMRDPYTAGHQVRVAKLAQAIAIEMQMVDERIRALHSAALIHDVGKINIPTEILSKPGKLTDAEYEIIKEHAQIGQDIVGSIDFRHPVAEFIGQHHERMDGSGYPNGLLGEDIHLEACILSVADVVEAMTAVRPYRQALDIQVVLQEIEENAGKLFDENAVKACLKLFQKKKFKF